MPEKSSSPGRTVYRLRGEIRGGGGLVRPSAGRSSVFPGEAPNFNPFGLPHADHNSPFSLKNPYSQQSSPGLAFGQTGLSTARGRGGLVYSAKGLQIFPVPGLPVESTPWRELGTSLHVVLWRVAPGKHNPRQYRILLWILMPGLGKVSPSSPTINVDRPIWTTIR